MFYEIAEPQRSADESQRFRSLAVLTSSASGSNPFRGQASVKTNLMNSLIKTRKPTLINP
jgi:hypothetical protein